MNAYGIAALVLAAGILVYEEIRVRCQRPPLRIPKLKWPSRKPRGRSKHRAPQA